jgi:hypothetical protein
LDYSRKYTGYSGRTKTGKAVRSGNPKAVIRPEKYPAVGLYRTGSFSPKKTAKRQRPVLFLSFITLAVFGEIKVLLLTPSKTPPFP